MWGRHSTLRRWWPTTRFILPRKAGGSGRCGRPDVNLRDGARSPFGPRSSGRRLTYCLERRVDVGGRLHCLDAETGQCYWVHETSSQVWGSTLVADGKVYMPTPKGLFVLAAGKEKKVLGQTNVGAALYASPVVANDTLYIASKGGWLWAVRQAGR